MFGLHIFKEQEPEPSFLGLMPFCEEWGHWEGVALKPEQLMQTLQILLCLALPPLYLFSVLRFSALEGWWRSKMKTSAPC